MGHPHGRLAVHVELGGLKQGAARCVEKPDDMMWR